MKRDLTNLLKREERPAGFETLDDAKEYVARYLLNYIYIELEGLPREEWEKTLETWAKMCAFAKGLLRKGEKERKEIYERFRFDMMMEGIIEDLRRTFIGMLSLGILKDNEPPHNLLVRAAELIKEDGDLMRRWELDPKVVRFIHKFYTSCFPKRK